MGMPRLTAGLVLAGALVAGCSATPPTVPETGAPTGAAPSPTTTSSSPTTTATPRATPTATPTPTPTPPLSPEALFTKTYDGRNLTLGREIASLRDGLEGTRQVIECAHLREEGLALGGGGAAPPGLVIRELKAPKHGLNRLIQQEPRDGLAAPLVAFQCCLPVDLHGLLVELCQ